MQPGLIGYYGIKDVMKWFAARECWKSALA
jgi:hypothetical protein